MTFKSERRQFIAAHRADFDELLAEQQTTVISGWEQTKALAAAAIFNQISWAQRLAAVVLLRNTLTATHFGRQIHSDLDTGALDAFLTINARYAGENFTVGTVEAVQEALAADEPRAALAGVFDDARGYRLDRFAARTVSTSGNFGMTVGAEQAGHSHKVWQVNSAKPRPGHARMSGERTPLGETFSNGMQYPGDPAGGADENAGCTCSLGFE